jgi:hypothetical protein
MGTIEDNLIGIRNGKFGVEPELLRPDVTDVTTVGGGAAAVLAGTSTLVGGVR